jgi:hypothetical protein
MEKPPTIQETPETPPPKKKEKENKKINKKTTQTTCRTRGTRTPDCRVFVFHKAARAGSDSTGRDGTSNL